MRVALTGNPNSGKNTMYNALTGRNEKIGNWAGVTVDRKESKIKKVYYDEGKELGIPVVVTKEKNKDDKLDAVLTHPFLVLIIFTAIMFGVFFISQSTVGTWLADILVGWIEAFQGWVGDKLADANPVLYALLVDGIIGGVGAVVGFLPLVMVMYFLIALLEDCGYMSRATVVLDPIFKRVGLSGKSVIPMIIGTG